MQDKTQEQLTQYQQEILLIEQRKAKALEKIANSVDAFTIWFEEIDKDEWSERIQHYLYEFWKMQNEKTESK
jgi:hypothetical protein